MDLKQASIEELKAELERKQKEKLKPPEQLEKVSLGSLRKICEDYINFVATDDYHEDDEWLKIDFGNDYERYIYETALETFYGPEIWDFINKEK